MLHFIQDPVQDSLGDLLIAKAARHCFGSCKSAELTKLVRGRSAAAQGKVGARTLAGSDTFRHFRPHGLKDFPLKDIRQAMGGHISKRHRTKPDVAETCKFGRECVDIPAMRDGQNGEGHVLVIAWPGLLRDIHQRTKNRADFADTDTALGGPVKHALEEGAEPGAGIIARQTRATIHTLDLLDIESDIEDPLLGKEIDQRFGAIQCGPRDDADDVEGYGVALEGCDALHCGGVTAVPLTRAAMQIMQRCRTIEADSDAQLVLGEERAPGIVD